MREHCIILILVVSVCLSAAAPAEDKKASSGLTVDKDKRTITIDAKIAPRKLDDKKFQGNIYPIEVIACWAYPKGQKAHETVVTFDIKPSEVHKALEDLGLKPGKPVKGEAKDESQGPEVNIYLDIPTSGDKPKRVSIEKTLVGTKTGKPMPKVKWRFTGSVMVKPDPNKEEKVYGADQSGTLATIFPVTDETVFQTDLKFKDQEYLRLETNKKVVPDEGTAVKLVIEVPK